MAACDVEYPDRFVQLPRLLWDGGDSFTTEDLYVNRYHVSHFRASNEREGASHLWMEGEDFPFHIDLSPRDLLARIND